MCLFGGSGKLAGAPAVKQRVETNTDLPTAKQTVDPDKTADVSYGSSKKKAGPAAAKMDGSAGLKIPMLANAQGSKAAKTGGLNV